MILVFCLVFAFLWGYLKKFPRSHKLKTISAVTVFSVLISFLISFLPVFGFYSAYMHTHKIWVATHTSTELSLFSVPFHLEVEYVPLIWPGMSLWPRYHLLFYRILFAGVQLLEMEFHAIPADGRLYIYTQVPESWQPCDADYAAALFFPSSLIFTALNMIGLPLVILTYNKRGILKKLNSRITEFKERHKDNSLYQWLFSD